MMDIIDSIIKIILCLISKIFPTLFIDNPCANGGDFDTLLNAFLELLPMSNGSIILTTDKIEHFLMTVIRQFNMINIYYIFFDIIIIYYFFFFIIYDIINDFFYLLSKLIILDIVLKSFILIIPILISVAFFTLLERKIMASIQKRRGPNVVGFFGILQPFADGLKLLIKETIIPSKANKIIFLIAPILSLFLSFLNWTVLPLGTYNVFSDINIGIIYIFSISSLSVYAIIMSGWSSNSRYAFLGTLRSSAQMVSYEVSIGLIIIAVLLCSNTLNLLKIVEGQKAIWYILPLFPLFLLFYISSLAETNRPPFDLPEAEAELVAGYFVEYSAMTFAQFFLGENINILLMCSLLTILFFGGWLFIYDLNYFIIFIIKLIFLLFSFVWVRVTFPRYRYDQLMRLGWKIFLPLSLGLVIFVASVLISFNFLF